MKNKCTLSGAENTTKAGDGNAEYQHCLLYLSRERQLPGPPIQKRTEMNGVSVTKDRRFLLYLSQNFQVSGFIIHQRPHFAGLTAIQQARPHSTVRLETNRANQIQDMTHRARRIYAKRSILVVREPMRGACGALGRSLGVVTCYTATMPDSNAGSQDAGL